MAKPMRGCPQCGDIVVRVRPTGPVPTYCSHKCRSRADHERRAEAISASGRRATLIAREAVARSCKRCGEPIPVTRTLNAVYCSAACSRRAAQISRSRTCSEPDCTRGVVARGLCKKHYARVTRTKSPWTARRKANKRKRNALKRGAESEAIVDVEVYDRDGWLCGICTEPVARSLVWPDPMSVSLDHVIPLSRGGAHVLDNVQCAHLSCNVRKGNRAA